MFFLLSFRFLYQFFYQVKSVIKLNGGSQLVSGPVPRGPVVSGPVPKFIVLSPFSIMFI